MPIFALSILPRSPKAMGRGGTDIHNKKGVFVRFCFDTVRISQIR